MKWYKRYDGIYGQVLYFVLSLIFFEFQLKIPPGFSEFLEHLFQPVSFTVMFFAEATQSYPGQIVGYTVGILVFGYLMGILVGLIIRLILRLFKTPKPVIADGNQDIKATEITEE